MVVAGWAHAFRPPLKEPWLFMSKTIPRRPKRERIDMDGIAKAQWDRMEISPGNFWSCGFGIYLAMVASSQLLLTFMSDLGFRVPPSDSSRHSHPRMLTTSHCSVRTEMYVPCRPGSYLMKTGFAMILPSPREDESPSSQDIQCLPAGLALPFILILVFLFLRPLALISPRGRPRTCTPAPSSTPAP